MNPIGDFSAQIKVMKTKADSFASRILSPRLTAKDIRVFHRSIYIPSMRYGLAAMAVDEEELAPVQSLVIKSILQRMGVQSTIPSAIRHGPPELGGLAIYDLRTEAGLEAVKFFRNAIYADSENGNMLRLNLQYSQLESGVGDSLLERPDLHIPYLTPTWLLSMRQFLFCHNMTITVSGAYSLPLRSDSDQYIMQQCHLSRYTVSQQRDINLVRLYLQVNTLADMTDAHHPKSIRLDYLDAIRPTGDTSDHPWPRQQPPMKSQKRLWKGYIRSSYLRYVPYWKQIPLSATVPATLDTSLPVPVTFPCLSTYLSSLPTSHRRLLADFDQVGTDVQVWRAFRSKSKLFVASDGGLHKQHGTHGWIVSTGKVVLFKCAGPIDGPFDTNSSTRCELGGCASCLLLLVSLSRFWGLKHRCSFRWYCDSKSAISRIQRYCRHMSRVTTMPYDADLLSLIKSLLQELRCKFTPTWVKGHQDNLLAYEKLPMSARLNIDADFLTTRYRQRGKLKSRETVSHEPTQQCSITINGVRLTGQYDDSIRYHINGYHLKQQLQQTNQWSKSVWEEVDFKVFGAHFRRLRPSLQVTHMKVVHNQLPLGDRRYRQASAQDDMLKLCPCCRNHSETMCHFLCCDLNPGKEKSLANLSADICNNDPHPVRYLLSSGMKHWYNQEAEPFQPDVSSFPEHMRDDIELALASQARIGWYQATKGFFSNLWSQLAMRDMYHSTKTDEVQGSYRMRQVLQATYAHNLRIWRSRNEVLHSSTIPQLSDIRSAEFAELRHIHGNPESLCLADRHMCEGNIERLLGGSSTTRRRWLRRAKRSIARYQREGKNQTRNTQFFTSHTG